MTTEELGTRTLYHATSQTAGANIFRSGRMFAGAMGMFGGGIYFAESEADARHKAILDQSGDVVLIIAEVDLGRALVLQRPANYMTLAQVQAAGCASIKGRRAPTAGWEFVVYEPHRVTVKSARGELLRDALPDDDGPPWGYGPPPWGEGPPPWRRGRGRCRGRGHCHHGRGHHRQQGCQPA
jgi:hypothetical protein